MGATLASLNAGLKQVWTQDTIERQFVDEHSLLKRFEATNRYSIGLKATVPIEVSRNGGYGAFPSAGSASLNVAGNVGIAAADYALTYHSQQVKIELAAIEQTEGKPQAVANAVDIEVKGALEGLRNQISRQLYMSGDALIANCGVTTATNVVQLQTTGQAKWAIDRGFLDVGMIVDIGTTASEASLAADQVISAVDPVNYTITIPTSITTTSAHYVSVANARLGTTSYEMNGLPNMVSTSSTLGGITVASQPKWKAGYVDTTTTSLTIAALLTAQQRLRQAGGAAPTLIHTSLLQQANFYALLQQQARYAGDSTLSVGSVESPTWNGMKFDAAFDAPDFAFYLLNPDDFLRVVGGRNNGKPFWSTDITGGAGGPLVHLQNTTGFVGSLFVIQNIGMKRRNRQASFTGLTT